MSKRKTKYVCQECGYESLRWLGKCTQCHNWNSFSEEVSQPKGRHQSSVTVTNSSKPLKIKKIQSTKEDRMLTKMREFNRVLGGGIVKGSLILIGGDPGIGKSTILLQTSAQLAEKTKVLYVSGEESTQQTKLRAERLHVDVDDLYVLAETNLHNIVHHIEDVQPGFVVIDSIQTIFKEEVTSAPGSVTQVRECTMELMRLAKTHGIPI